MSKDYTQFDWAVDRLARATWEDQEDRLYRSIDRRLNKRRPDKKRSRKHNKNN